jgi:hypothetical protein
MLTANTLTPNFYFLKTTKEGQPATEKDQQVKPKIDDDSDEKRALCCAECRHPITRQRDRTEKNGQHHHVFANPHGYMYQIGCFAQAPGCLTTGGETSYFSWFPGYTWQIAICGNCLTLLGWAFRGTDNQFFGLIVDKLVESDAE